MASELHRQLQWSETVGRLYHYRTVTGQGVDFIIERLDGGLLAFEVQGTASPGRKDVAGLRLLQERCGGKLVAGVLLYTGEQRISVSEKIMALPVSALWA